MTTLLLDTTFLIDVLNDRRGRADLTERMILEHHTLSFTGRDRVIHFGEFFPPPYARLLGWCRAGANP